MPALSPGLIHLWVVKPTDLNSQAERLAGFLSADEQARAAGYKLDAPRRQFVLARGFLRSTLAAYLDKPPESLRFGTTGNEKPILLDVQSLHFNLSHTAGAIAIAVANDRAVGVDVEQVEPRRSLIAIAEQQFHPSERADVLAASDEDRLDVFYRIWTCKEAYLKGLGHGFAQPLNSFAMRLVHDRYLPTPNLDEQDWSVISQVEDRCALAVAAPGQWQLVRCGRPLRCLP